MFPITITLHDAAQLNAVMCALHPTIPAPVVAPAPEVTAKKSAKATPAPQPVEAPAPSSPTAEVAVAAAPAPSTAQPAPQPSTAPAADANSAGSTVTYQDAAGAITKLSRTKGRDAAIAVLAKFGAAKLPDVKAEQYADVLAAANEAMGA